MFTKIEAPKPFFVFRELVFDDRVFSYSSEKHHGVCFLSLCDPLVCDPNLV